MWKLKFLAGAFCAYSVLSMAICREIVPVKELACVNNEVITNLDVEKRKKLLFVFSQNSSIKDQFIENAILETIIQEKIKYEYVKRVFKQMGQPLNISKNDISDEITNMAASYGLTKDAFLQALKAQGVDLESLNEHVRNSLAWNIYLGAKYDSSISFSNSEVQSYQNKLKSEYKKRAYNVERLFFPYRAFGGDKSKTKTFVQQVLKLLNLGINFDLLSRVFSGISSSTRNGTYGFIIAGQLPYKAENDRITTMHQGETAVLELDNGISIIRVLGVRAASSEAQEIVSFKYVVSYTDVQDQAGLEQCYMQFLERVKKNKNIASDFIENAAKYNYKVSEMNEANSATLPVEIKNILSKLQINKASDPIVTPEGVISICLLKKELFRVKVPDLKECREKMYTDRLNNVSDTEYRNASNSIAVKRR